MGPSSSPSLALRNRNRSCTDSLAVITPDDFSKGHSANDGVVDPGGGKDRNDLATAVRAGWRKPRSIVTENDPGFGTAEDEFRVGCDGQQRVLLRKGPKRDIGFRLTYGCYGLFRHFGPPEMSPI